MAHTDKDERCHCQPGSVKCPHCGVSGNADHKARCHREYTLKMSRAVSAEARARRYESEWRPLKRWLKRRERGKWKREVRSGPA